MMEKTIFVAVFVLSTVNGFYIKNDQSQTDHASGSQRELENKFEHITNSWLKYKQQFQSDPETEDFNQEKDRFNELEVLELIPTVIDHYRGGQISQDEESLLSEIYGNLWTIIVHEAKRKANEEMNPILKSLFGSFYLTKGVTNDVAENTVQKVPKKMSKPRHKLLLRINKEDHPSQRILNTAAMLIHYDRNNEHRRHHREVTPEEEVKQEKPSTARTATINLQLSNIPIDSITKSKRNFKVHLKGNDLVASKVDAILQMNGDRFYSTESDDDDDDDDYEDDKIRSGKKDNLDYYEDNYEYDEKVGSPSSDPEYGSFQDLIYLAAKHRLRRQKEETKLKASKRHFFSLNDAD